MQSPLRGESTVRAPSTNGTATGGRLRKPEMHPTVPRTRFSKVQTRAHKHVRHCGTNSSFRQIPNWLGRFGVTCYSRLAGVGAAADMTFNVPSQRPASHHGCLKYERGLPDCGLNASCFGISFVWLWCRQVGYLPADFRWFSMLRSQIDGDHSCYHYVMIADSPVMQSSP